MSSSLRSRSVTKHFMTQSSASFLQGLQFNVIYIANRTNVPDGAYNYKGLFKKNVSENRYNPRKTFLTVSFSVKYPSKGSCIIYYLLSF